MAEGSFSFRGPTRNQIYDEHGNEIKTLPIAPIRCFVCDDAAQMMHSLDSRVDLCVPTTNRYRDILKNMVSPHCQMNVPKNEFVCERCRALMEQYDRLVNERDFMRGCIRRKLFKKYNLGPDATPTAHVDNKATPQHTDDPCSGVEVDATRLFFICKKCYYKHDDVEVFNKHFRNCKMFPFNCKRCKENFYNFEALNTHTSHVHGLTIEYTWCFICVKGFKTAAELQEHLQAKHSTYFEPTATTSVIVPTPDALAFADSDQTVNTDNTDNTEAVEESEEIAEDVTIFPKDDDHQEHSSLSDGEKVDERAIPYACSLCLEEFETVSEIERHFETFNNLLRQCCACKTFFEDIESLKLHVKEEHDSVEDGNSTESIFWPEKELPPNIFVVCAYCGAAFEDDEPYNEHVKTHETKDGGQFDVVVPDDGTSEKKTDTHDEQKPLLCGDSSTKNDNGEKLKSFLPEDESLGQLKKEKPPEQSKTEENDAMNQIGSDLKLIKIEDEDLKDIKPEPIKLESIKIEPIKIEPVEPVGEELALGDPLIIKLEGLTLETVDYDRFGPKETHPKSEKTLEDSLRAAEKDLAIREINEPTAGTTPGSSVDDVQEVHQQAKTAMRDPIGEDEDGYGVIEAGMKALSM